MTEATLSPADRIAGGLVGLLVGDALGVPYEFNSREAIPPALAIEFEPPEGFRRAHAGVPPGTWSDDGAQALVLLDSLLARGRLDVDHFAQGLVDWYETGFMAVDGAVFDVGIQTRAAIGRLKLGVPPLQAGAADELANGNGSLMRVLPLALWHDGSDERLIADAFDQSASTHGHVRAKLCCAFYCLWARRTLDGAEDGWDLAAAAMRDTFPEGTSERAELDELVLPAKAAVKGSGYVVDSLHAARWANNGTSYEAVVRAAISLGDDTDTTACIAGGIAGLRFGLDAIPSRWRDQLRGRQLFEPLLAKLLTGWAGAEPIGVL